MSRKEHEEWVVSVLAGVLQDSRVRELAWQLARSMRESSDPEVTQADMTGSITYLRACLLRRSQTEIAVMTMGDHSALWSLGALGHARYRAQRAVRLGGHTKLRKRRPR